MLTFGASVGGCLSGASKGSTGLNTVEPKSPSSSSSSY